MSSPSSSPWSSFSAHCFSKEEEERELNELTETEKEAILDDKYGRRRRQNGDDNDNDISDELLRSFHRAREVLPLEIGEYFWMAFFENEEVVEEESTPELFLRCEHYDAERAARRQGEYWKLRYEIFGEVDAVKPLTLDGAMRSVVPYMVQIPNFCRILPGDDQGRTVLCFDMTVVGFKDYDDLVLLKIIWFVFHKALEQQQQAQRNGVVLIFIALSSSFDLPSRRLIKMMSKTMYNCLPVKICFRHGCISSFVASFIVPIVNDLAPQHIRLRAQLYNCLHLPHVLNEMKDYGLQRNNLPKSIGGSYDEKSSWIHECERIMIMTKQEEQRYRDKRHRTTYK